MILFQTGAAALHFEHVLELVISYVIGWDVKKRRPFKRGGFFGIPKAWLRVVEEQGRLTLHAHCLIWIYGHYDIQGKFQRASWNIPERMETEHIILNKCDSKEVTIQKFGNNSIVYLKASILESFSC